MASAPHRTGRCCPKKKAPAVPPVPCCPPDDVDPSLIRQFAATFTNGSVAPFLIAAQSAGTVIGPSPGPPAPNDDPTQVVQLFAPGGGGISRGIILEGPFPVGTPSVEAVCLCSRMRAVGDGAARYHIGLAAPNGSIFTIQGFQGATWELLVFDADGVNLASGGSAVPVDATPHDFKLCAVPNGTGGADFSLFIDGVLVATVGPVQIFQGPFTPYISVANEASGDASADLRIDTYCTNSGPISS